MRRHSKLTASAALTMYCVISSKRDKYLEPEASIFSIIADIEPMIPAYIDAPASMLQIVTTTSEYNWSTVLVVNRMAT